MSRDTADYLNRNILINGRNTMSKSTDIIGYTYNAENYCPNCILTAFSGVREEIGFAFSVEGVLDIIAGVMEIDRYDERSFDSSEFPKVIFDSQIEDEEKCGNPNCWQTLR